MSAPARSRDTRERLLRVVATVAVLAVAPVAMALVPGLPNIFASTYFSGVFVDVVLFALFGIALNVVFGHTDQLFLFLGGLSGVGAYVTTLLANDLGVFAWAALLVGAGLAGLTGLLVSWISAKREFSVILISILTLNLQLALTELFVGARDLTGGTTGRAAAALPGLGTLGEIAGGDEVALYYVLLGVLLVVLVAYVRLIDSKYGLAFSTIREDEIAAEAIGVDVVRYKTIAGTMAATLVGVVGVFYGQAEAFLLPSNFAFATVDVVVLIMLIIGGLRTALGPVIGAVIVKFLQEALSSVVGEWETAVFGGLLIVLFLYFRRGVVPAARAFVTDLAGRDTSATAGTTDVDADSDGDPDADERGSGGGGTD